MAKRKRSQRVSAQSVPPATRPQVSARSAGMPDWRWRSFPVFCAFVAGLLIASIINGEPNNTPAAVVQIVALVGVVYAVVHLFVINVLISGRIRRREAGLGTPAPDEDDWVDEVVQPDEAEAQR